MSIHGLGPGSRCSPRNPTAPTNASPWKFNTRTLQKLKADLWHIRQELFVGYNSVVKRWGWMKSVLFNADHEFHSGSSLVSEMGLVRKSLDSLIAGRCWMKSRKQILLFFCFCLRLGELVCILWSLIQGDHEYLIARLRRSLASLEQWHSLQSNSPSRASVQQITWWWTHREDMI